MLTSNCRLPTCAVRAVLAAAAVTAVAISPRVPDAAAQTIDFSHPAYKDIERLPSRGHDHVSGRVDYGTPFPTSGPHAPNPAQPGRYGADEVAPEALVHALEHGNIVIYYDTPGEDALKAIRQWTDSYRGAMDGVIAVRRPGLGSRVVLTAWQHKLEIDGLDVRATYFIDAFRGRGPERRVR